MGRKRLSVLAGAVVFGLFCAVSFPLHALERPNIVVIGNDFDRGTVARQSRVFDGVLDRLSSDLYHAGFAVFDETSIALEQETKRARRRSEAQIVAAARAVTRPPLDIAVVFSIYAHAEAYTYSKKLSSRLTARLLDLRSGRHLGSFEVTDPQPYRAPLSCARNCMLELLNEATRTQAEELADLLVERLSSLDAGFAAPTSVDQPSGHRPAAGYRLQFDGFTDAEVAEMEEYLVVFKSYRLHRPIVTGGGRHEFWYETTSPRARLNRNLIKMLQHVRLAGRVGFADETFTLARSTESAAEQKAWDAW